MSKVSQLTALTGANLANGDQFLVTDVGSPNVSKSITADQLAQGSQFSSRYVAKADDKYLWVPAQAMTNEYGPAGQSNVGNLFGTGYAKVFDQTTAEWMSTSVVLPQFWTRWKLEMYWANASSSSGDVKWNCNALFAGATERPDGSGVTRLIFSTQTIAAPSTAGEIKISQLHTATDYALTADKPLFVAVFRDAGDAADTLANDAAVYGLLFTRTA